MDFLIALDHKLFVLFNGTLSNRIFDIVMPAITDLHKSPAFGGFFLIFLLMWIYRQRTDALKWIFALIVAIGLSDAISYRVIKANTMRDRPEKSGVEVVLRTHQHSGTSFPSNHAANIFAAATVLSAVFPVAAPFLYLIALTVAFSRVYVGVHFPFDVLVGALLGISLGAATRWGMRYWVGEQWLRKKHHKG